MADLSFEMEFVFKYSKTMHHGNLVGSVLLLFMLYVSVLLWLCKKRKGNM